jgi:hypothetical protein
MTMASAPPFNQKLPDGIPRIGIRTQSCSPTVTEVIGLRLRLRLYRHGARAEQPDAGAGGRRCERSGPPPGAVPVIIQVLLDIGIEYLVVPMVEVAAQARHGAKAALYAFRGTGCGNLDPSTTGAGRVSASGADRDSGGN